MKPGTIIFFALFTTAVVSAWVWFNAAPPPDSAGIWLEAHSNLPGHTFTHEPLTKTALEILGTDDFVNGFFSPQDTEHSGANSTQVIRVFSANWSAERGQGMAVVQHTPDICWVGAGWKPVDLGQPKQVEVEIPVKQSPGSSPAATESVKLPFECRVFRSSDGRSHELVLWCTLVSGRVLSEQSRFDSGKPLGEGLSEREHQLAAGRRLSASYFGEALKHRLRTRGTKQFVRLSAPVDPVAPLLVNRVARFGSAWTQARQFKPTETVSRELAR